MFNTFLRQTALRVLFAVVANTGLPKWTFEDPHGTIFQNVILRPVSHHCISSVHLSPGAFQRISVGKNKCVMFFKSISAPSADFFSFQRIEQNERYLSQNMCYSLRAITQLAHAYVNHTPLWICKCRENASLISNSCIFHKPNTLPVWFDELSARS